MAHEFAARYTEQHRNGDFEGEASANSAAHGVATLMAFVPAKSLAELLIKARAARLYIERTDDKLPDDPLDRLWLSIADDIERLAREGAR